MARITDDPRRQQRLALLLTWRTFRQSVARGKPMTLPNLLRLYQRCRNEHCPGMMNGDQSKFLRRQYHTQQPFTNPHLLPHLTHDLP